MADGSDELVYLPRDGSAGGTVIGALGRAAVEAIALSLDGQTLYAADADDLGILNWTTGQYTQVGVPFGTGSGAEGNIAFTDVDGLCFDPLSGIFYGSHRRSGAEDLLFQIDTSDGSYVDDAFGPGIDYVVIDTFEEVGLYDVDDIAIDPITGQMFGVVNSSGGNDRIVEINKYDGSIIDIGRSHTSAGDLSDVEGLCFHNDGNFYGTTGNNGAAGTNNTVWQINTSTALFTEVHSIDYGVDYEGIAGLIEGSNMIYGTVWEDEDADETIDGGELGELGVTVYLYVDVNDDGAVDPGDILGDNVVTDANGDYEFEVAVQGNFVIKIDTGTLPSGAAMTTDNIEEADFVGFGNSEYNNDFGFRIENASIEDFVWLDQDGDAVQDAGEPGLSSVDLKLYRDENGDGLLDAGDTYLDTQTTVGSGYYSFDSLPEGEYIVDVDDSTLPAGVTHTTSNDPLGVTLTVSQAYTDADFGYQGTGSIGNYVWNDEDGEGDQDAGESGLTGIDLKLYRDENGDGLLDGGDTLLDTDTTDGSGNYDFNALPAGDYLIDVDDTTLPVGFVITGGTDPHAITLPAGQNYDLADFGFQLRNSSIGDLVWLDLDADGSKDASEIGLSAIDVKLYSDENGDGLLDGGDTLLDTETTDSSGNYLFDELIAGDYIIDVDDSTLPVGVTITTANDPLAVTLTDNDDYNTADFGYKGTGSIGDYIWHDEDSEGDQDLSESGLAFVDVFLYHDVNGDGFIDGGDVLLLTETTGPGGIYSFDNLPAYDYIVHVDDTTLPTNFSITGGTDPLAETLSAGENYLSADFGFNESITSIGNRVWYDSDQDGIQDPGEGGQINVTVKLYHSGGSLAGTTITNSSGEYSFTDLTPGDYYLDFILPTNFAFSPQDSGGDDSVDSDANTSTGLTAVTTLSAGENDTSWDAGVYATGVVHPDCTLLYAVSDGTDQLVYLPLDGSSGATLIGSLGVTNVEATALSLDGQTLYAANANTLGILDWDSGAFSAVGGTFGSGTGSVGTIAFSDVDGLAFDPLSGVLYGTVRRNDGAPEDALIQINTETGSFVADAFGPDLDYVIIDTFVETGLYDVDDIAIDPTDGQMYAVVNSSGGNDRIVKIDKYTGDVTDVGRSHSSSGNVDDVEGLAFHNSGNFYGTTGATSTAWLIDTSNALFTEVHTMGIGSDYEAIAGLTCGSNLITGNVFVDEDNDGINDFIEDGQQNVTVNLYVDVNDNGTVDAGDIFAQTQTTDANGDYEFEIGTDGHFVIEIDQSTLPVGAEMTTDNIEEADFVDWGFTDANNDFGFYMVNATIGDFVWNDKDGDAVQDAGEPGLSSVDVRLYRDENGDGLLDGGDTLLNTQTTDGSGFYQFTGLTADYYIVDVDASTLPTGLTHTTSNDPLDLYLSTSENHDTADFGYQGEASIGDYLWIDMDGEGDQDAGESPLTGVDVKLYRDENGDGLLDAGDTLLETDTTDGSGNYLFASLTQGDYLVDVDDTTLPAGYVLTGGTDPQAVSLSAEENYLVADFGYQPQNSSIGDFIWFDQDGDGEQDAGEVGFPDVDVKLYLDENGDGLLDGGDTLLDTQTTDANGNYTFDTLPPGSYIVDVDDTTLPADISSTTANDPLAVELEADEDYDTADFGYRGNGSIGDYLWYDADAGGDQDPTENGIASVDVFLYRDNNGDGLIDAGDTLIDTQTTDGSGNYLFSYLPVDDYIVDVDDTTLPANYASTTQNDPYAKSLGFGENDLSADFGYDLATASIGNYVWLDTDADGNQDGGETGLPNVDVKLYRDMNGDGLIDGGDILLDTQTTDGSGNYLFGNLPAFDYIVDVDDTTLPGVTITTSNDPLAVTLSDGQNYTTADFGYVGSASVSGYIWKDDNRNGIFDEDVSKGEKNLDVYLYDSDNNLIGTYLTEDNPNKGYYEFTNLPAGDYYIIFELKANWSYTYQDAGSDDSIDSDADPFTGRTDVFSLAIGEDKTRVDCGEIKNTVGIGDFVWDDLDGDGIQDEGEPGIENVTVNLYDSNDNLIATTTTDSEGKYVFTGFDGDDDYYVGFETVSGYFRTSPNQGGNDDLDSDADPVTGLTPQTYLPDGTVVDNWDAGYYEASTIGDKVTYDINGDGVQDPGEPGLAGVDIQLYIDENGDGILDGGDTLLDTQTTDADGLYQFTNLPMDDYLVNVVDATLPADVVLTGGRTDPHAVTIDVPGTEYVDADFTYWGDKYITGLVWEDEDRDAFDGSPVEPLVEGITVTLYNEDDVFIRETTTDVNGEYIFEHLITDNYYIVFSDLPEGFLFTDKDECNPACDDTVDSDADESTGTTDLIALTGAYEDDWDAGIHYYDLAVDDINEIPDRLSLSNPYPNPFNPVTRLHFELPSMEHVSIRIYNTTGQLIDVLLDEVHQPGRYDLLWDGSDQPSGIYFVQVLTREKTITKKMMLVK